MAYISLFLPARLEKKRIEGFREWFKSVIAHTDNLSNVEAIVKLDECDPGLQEALEIIEEYKSKFTIKYLISPRGRGYHDLSKHYMDLLFLLDINSKMIMAGSIDMRFQHKGYDTVLLESDKIYEDGIYVMHLKLMQPFTNNSITSVNRAAQHVDAFPVWSRKWIETQGHFGYNAFNDGYTSIVEYLLAHEYGINRRIDLTKYNYIKEVDGYGPDSTQWQSTRKQGMESHLSEEGIHLARCSAKNIYLNIVDNEAMKTQNATRLEVYHKYLIQSLLKTYDAALMLGLEDSLTSDGKVDNSSINANLKKKIRNKYRARMIKYMAVMVVIILALIYYIMKHALVS